MKKWESIWFSEKECAFWKLSQSHNSNPNIFKRLTHGQLHFWKWDAHYTLLRNGEYFWLWRRMLVKCWNTSITIKYNVLQVLTPSQVKFLSEIFSWLNSLTQASKVFNHQKTTEMHQRKKNFSAVPHYFSWNINLILKVDQLNVGNFNAGR